MRVDIKKQGEQAYKDGKDINDTPYDSDNDWNTYIEWRMGWKNAERDEKARKSRESKQAGNLETNTAG